MKVETGGLIYDDSDQRCTIQVKNTVSGGKLAYMIFLSCFDISTGSTNWYHGVIKQHFFDLDDQGRALVARDIMQNGGKTWDLLDSLKSTADYIESLYA